MRISVAGSIAEAAVDITNLFSTAQLTVDLYLHEISCMKADTERACANMIEEARARAEQIIADAEKRSNAINYGHSSWPFQDEIQIPEQMTRKRLYEDIGNG